MVVYETLSGNYDGAASRIYKDYLTIDTQNAMKLNKDIVSTSGKISYTINGNNKSMFTTETAEWNVVDNVGTAKYVIDTTWLEKHSQNIRWIKDDVGNDIDLSKGYVELTYNLDDYTSLACGRTIMYREINGDNIDDCMITFIPKTGEITQVSLVDKETGTKLETTSDIVNPNASLISEKIVDDSDNKEDPYDCLMANIDGLYKNYYMATYKIQYKNGSKLIDTSKKVTLKFKIPDDWNADKVQLATFIDDLGTNPNVNGTVEKTDDGNYFVISTNKLGHYALYETKTTQDADKLENGTYTIPVSVYHLTKEGQLSMANRCLGGTAELVVNDDVKTLYMDYTSVENMSLTSYMTKMWIYGADMEMKGNQPTGSLIPVVFTSYYKNEDGSYLTDSFNEGTLNYYPKTGYVQLVSDKAQWPARFKVPIMDAIGGGNFEQDAWLTLDWANAKKTSDDIPNVPIKSGLKELLSIEKTAIRAEYTADSWSNMTKVYDEAEKIYKNDSSSEEELTNAYISLRTAIDSLEKEKAPELTEGVYTANGKIDDTEYITDTRFLVGEDGKKSDIYLKSKDIQQFEYYDLTSQEYKEAKLIKNDKEEVTGIEFGLNEMANSVSVRYQTADGKTAQGLLTFADMSKQEVNKDSLKEIINTAQEKLKDAAENPENYDSKAVSALQTAVSNGTEVFKNLVSIQSEVDEQVDAINVAINNVETSGAESMEYEFKGAEAENVTFAYGEEVILDNYSLKLQPGKITGIHGASGSGKSTLLKLLMRFWDVQDGSVSVDGTDVRKIPTKHLRDMESYVTQETHLFHDSIANNIAIAKPGASREEIMEAAKKASIHDFIMTLPKGYDTEVGELGDTLSGGEKQRIGIARAFLHECPLILLDEPTSNLDSLNEGIILKSLKESAEKKTVVLVSHRVSTMNVADVVYEMENGRIS